MDMKVLNQCFFLLNMIYFFRNLLFMKSYSVILMSMTFEVIIYFIRNMYTSGHSQQKAWTSPVNTTP